MVIPICTVVRSYVAAHNNHHGDEELPQLIMRQHSAPISTSNTCTPTTTVLF